MIRVMEAPNEAVPNSSKPSVTRDPQTVMLRLLSKDMLQYQILREYTHV